jgi:poly-gamma-glutamate synthesis protein (capsule biosynthesis protein)
MERLSILFTGDIYPGVNIRISDELSARMRQADYRAANLECVMGDFDFSEAATHKTVLPCASPDNVALLKSMGLDYVTLANNHMFDYGVKGYLSNAGLLASAGIAYSGAGENIEQAARPHVFEKNGIKVAIVSCAWCGTEAVYATQTSAGCAPLDESQLLQIPQTLKSSGVDHVILYVHWGYCGYSCPMPEQKSIAERLIKSGYTAIVGHHHHQLNGMLTVDGRVVVFGLGDFIFAPYVNPYGKRICSENINCRSAVFELTLDKSGITGKDIIFTLQNGDVIELDNNTARKKDFDRLSRMLLVSPYEKAWKRAVRRRLLMRVLHWANPLNWKDIKPKTFNALLIMVKDIFVKNVKK